jgi:UDP-glucose 4-epimerase
MQPASDLQAARASPSIWVAEKAPAYNELVEAVEHFTEAFQPGICPKAHGDPPELVADNTNAKLILGWQAKVDLPAIVMSAWAWHLRT